MSFMIPEIESAAGALECETETGETFYIPFGVLGRGESPDDYRPEYCAGKVETVKPLQSGYLCRLSAPGYMDCTEWEYCETRADVREWERDNADDDSDD